MSTLDEITKEKQRVSETLARVDAQREKLTGQLKPFARGALYLMLRNPSIEARSFTTNNPILANTSRSSISRSGVPTSAGRYGRARTVCRRARPLLLSCCALS